MRGGCSRAVAVATLLAAHVFSAQPGRAEHPCAAPALDARPAATQHTRDPALTPAAWLAPCEAALVAVPASQRGDAAMATLREAIAVSVVLVRRLAQVERRIAEVRAFELTLDVAPPPPRVAPPRAMPADVTIARATCQAYLATPTSAALRAASQGAAMAKAAIKTIYAKQVAIFERERDDRTCDGPGPWLGV